MKSKIQIFIKLMSVIILFGWCSSSAKAALTYTYVGSLFTSGPDAGDSTPVNLVGTATFKNISDSNFSGEISGTSSDTIYYHYDYMTGQYISAFNPDLSFLQFNSPSQSNAYAGGLYSLGDYNVYLDTSALSRYDFVFVDGKITKWTVEFDENKLLGAGTTSTGDVVLVLESIIGSDGPVFTDYASTSPGTWTQVSPVPLPAALPMFSAALLGLFGIGMKSRRDKDEATRLGN